MDIKLGKYRIVKFDEHNLMIEVDKYDLKDRDKSVARAKRSWRNKKKTQLIGYAKTLEEAVLKIFEKELSNSDAKNLKELKNIIFTTKSELIQEIKKISRD